MTQTFTGVGHKLMNEMVIKKNAEMSYRIPF